MPRFGVQSLPSLPLHNHGPRRTHGAEHSRWRCSLPSSMASGHLRVRSWGSRWTEDVERLQNVSVDDKRLLATAYHEAGHAVAARRLGQGVTGISIVPDSESRGRTTGHKRSIDASRRFFAQLEEADYDAGWGGSIKGRLRRRVERTVMVLLAGGMAEMRATGAGLSDV